MNKTLITFFTVLFCMTSSFSWSEMVDDLVEWGGNYYQKVTLIPFTEKLTGSEQGSIKNGKREGTWVGYYDNGQLWYKGDYNDSVEKSKNGDKDGTWVHYWKNGQLRIKYNYKNDKFERAFVSYHENGQLNGKGNYKNGKEEGAWVVYHEDGTAWLKFTGTFQDGVNIND